MVVVEPSDVSYHDTKHDEPDYDNLQRTEDSLSDQDTNSESEDEEELNGIVLRTFFIHTFVQ